MTAIHRALCLTAALLVGTIAPGAGLFKAEAQQGSSMPLDAALAGAHRSAANKARDRYRHPKETLEFFGLRPEMTVVEIWPGGGRYTEILAPALRERGKLYAALYGSSPPFPYQAREMESFRAKLASAPAIYDRVTISALGFPNQLEIAPPGSVDLVVTFRNVHNWFQEGYGPPNAAGFAFDAIFTALKPGASRCRRSSLAGPGNRGPELAQWLRLRGARHHACRNRRLRARGPLGRESQSARYARLSGRRLDAAAGPRARRA